MRVKFQRNRQKKKEALEAGEGDDEVEKEDHRPPMTYIDRDRAAAVGGGEKNIKSNLKVMMD